VYEDIQGVAVQLHLVISSAIGGCEFYFRERTPELIEYEAWWAPKPVLVLLRKDKLLP
jgi:hypothetical protein